MSKKIVILCVLGIYLLSAYFSYSFFGNKSTGPIKSPISLYTPPKSGETSNLLPDEPKTESCPLTGEALTKTQKELWEKRRPLGVMIENHVEARPQSGIPSADIVYEAVAEGGITRFLAIFYCKDAQYVGPVRSARVYFVDLLAGYGAYPLYAHVGGANTDGPADALSKIGKLKWNLYNDLNQFAVPFPYYWRDYERLPGRITEHTVYSTTQKLWTYAKEKRKLTDVDEDGHKWDENFVAWKVKKADPSRSPSASKISFDFWDNKTEYTVVWDYVTDTNRYARSNGGQPHTDKNTGKQISAPNVVIVFVQESSANDGYPGGHMLYKLIGSGMGIIFQDGKAVPMKWEKADAFSLLQFTDEGGDEIAFNPGQVFVEIVPKGNEVRY